MLETTEGKKDVVISWLEKKPAEIKEWSFPIAEKLARIALRLFM